MSTPYMPSVNEKSSCTLALSFTDETGAAVIPSGATYQIDDVTSGTSIKGSTAFSPSSSTYNLDIAYGDNRLLDTTQASEEHMVTITWQYGSGKQGTKEYHYKVVNLAKIS